MRSVRAAVAAQEQTDEEPIKELRVPPRPYISLDEVHEVQLSRDAARQPHTAKEIIDEAFARTVALFAARPEKETLYFSVNGGDPPGSTRIGLAIFAGAVGADVVDYISERIQAVPAAVAAAAAAAAPAAPAASKAGRWQGTRRQSLQARLPAKLDPIVNLEQEPQGQAQYSICCGRQARINCDGDGG